MLRPSSYLGGHPNNNCHHVLSAYLVKTLLSPLSSLEGGASIILEKEAQRNEEICPRSHCWDFVVELGSGAGNWASESKLLSTRLPEEVHTPGAKFTNVHPSTAENTKRCEQLHYPSKGEWVDLFVNYYYLGAKRNELDPWISRWTNLRNRLGGKKQGAARYIQ